MVQILVFGDSVAYGAWDREGGWVGRLKAFVTEKTIATNQKFYCTVHNLGISGDTTDDILERFEYETRQRLEEHDETIIIFAIGTNDTIFDSKNIFWTQKEKFKDNVGKLIGIAKKYSLIIVFNGLTPVDESMTNPVSWDANVNYKNEYLQQYDGIIKAACMEKNIHFIDIFGEWTKSDYKSLLEDGVHPNSEGHKRIFRAVKNFLAKNKIL